MAHFAEIDENNIVTRVVVIANGDTLHNGVEAEWVGVDRCIALFGGGTWKQTSFNRSFRKNYAAIGHMWDSARDAFIPPQPFPSWTLNETTCQWEAPLAYPGYGYDWDEATQIWVLL